VARYKAIKLRFDGGYDIVWISTNARVAIWTIDVQGTFSGVVGLGGPANWTVESHFLQ